MPVRPGHDPLVDRDVELCRLDEHVRALADRRESAAVTLAGPSGTGLTTLLEHVVRRARERELTVALARCSPAEVELPYGVVSQLGAELSHAAYRPSLRALSRTGQETAAVAELCAEFLALARHGPVLLAVDDAHWADPLSRRWLRAFAARLRQAPVLLVRTLVPGASTPDHHPPGIEHPVTVRPLGEEAVDELIGSRLGERADRSFLAGATELTGGRVAVLRPSLDRYARDSLTPVAERLPVLAGYVAEVLGERAARIVDRLPPEALAVVRAIAVAGDDLEPTFVHALASPRTPPATAVLDGLAALGLVTRTERPRLTAPTVRARVLAGMGTGERERMAGRAAELARRMALPDERIACLLPAAPPGTVGWGVPLLRRIAERARAAGEPDDAAALLNRALRERPGPELRHELLTDLALTERPGDPDAAARRLRQVLLEAGPEIPLRGLVRAADLLQALGEAPVARHAIAAACAR
ncbi:AAA family ATPase, partial [Amycolatopsis cihanbeyliensis]